jgi:hypothetical protein
MTLVKTPVTASPFNNTAQFYTIAVILTIG